MEGKALSMTEALGASRDTDYACILLGNRYNYPKGPFQSRYALGATAVLNGLTNWHDLANFTKPGREVFGYLGYDLKNRLEGLQSQHPPLLPFPPLCLFYPESSGLLNGVAYDVPTQGITGVTHLHCLTSWEDYQLGFDKIRHHLYEGDIYEMNYCIGHTFRFQRVDPQALFQQLNRLSPNPFAGFMKLGHRYILSASPERFIKRSGNQLVSQPIKGTAARHPDHATDHQLRETLRHSPKEQAENRMIVDLVRNDLTRVGIPGTTQVPELFGIYSFPAVHQMISTVATTLPGHRTFAEIVAGTFPMGSMTGAPKISAMQIIDSIEGFARGPFSGALGVLDANGDCDFNVLIRSLFLDVETGQGFFCTGGAITWQSDARAEYDECLLKARALLQLLRQ